MGVCGRIIETIKEWVWGPGLLIFMLVVGVYYTVKSGFFQIRGWKVWWGNTVGEIGEAETDQENQDRGSVRENGTITGENRNDGNRYRREGVSQFQTVCTALAATVGTGNIAGVATALVAGGPGAVFWMWISSLAGMMMAYAENFLGIAYRERGNDGQFHGGPMFYIEKGMKRKWLAVVYAVCTVLASLGMGSMVQANSVADTLYYTFHCPTFWTAVVLTGVAALVLWGGIGRIAQVTEKLIPFSAGIYIVLVCVVILANIKELPAVLVLICADAFCPESIVGGALGYGISRGVFSNEAGLGSLAILHSSTESATPCKQGMWGIFEVFFDTILMCTLTAAAILIRPEVRNAFSGYRGIGAGMSAGVKVSETGQRLNGAALASWAISKTVGEGGNVFIALAMVCFAFATIIGWYYLGSQAAAYLTGGNLFLYRLVYLNAVFLGCVLQLNMVWDISDIFNGMMAVPNLIALISLRKQVEFPRNFRTPKKVK